MAAALLVTAACEQAPESNGGNAKAVELPNIVLIVADDFGAPYHGFMGNTDVETPNLDALAKSGIVFRNGYAPANHCRPSLRSMVTGLLPIEYEALEAENKLAFEVSDRYAEMSSEEQRRWSDQYQFHSMKDIDTLPGLLADIGYLTWQGGKWWEFNYQNGHFSHGMTTGWAPEDVGREDWFLELMGGDGRELARKDNQAAYDFVDAAGDRPFFMWYAPELPHYPFEAPQRYLDIYKDRGYAESAVLYYANCSLFDDQLGELLTFLDERGKLDNTLVVYVNDNGWEQEPQQEYVGDPMRYNNGGDRGKLGKTDLSFRTPIIFSWPGRIGEGEVTDALIHAADIPATILEYVGLTMPAAVYGESYADVISGDSGAAREAIVGRFTQLRWEGDMMGRKANGYWIRSGPWFLSWDLDDGKTVLNDVSGDPRSDADVSSEHAELVAELKDRIQSWKEHYDN